MVVLSGAGLSKASGIPTFRDAGGLWEGNRIEDVASPAAWRNDPTMVRRFYDQRRVDCAAVLQNPGHEAVARLQHALGTQRCTLVTQNIDGLLQKAGAHDVIEMHGSLWKLRCSDEVEHPSVGVFGAQNPARSCAICGAALRPDVVWFGELPYEIDRITAALGECDFFLAVGTSGVVYPAADFVRIAKTHGAKCIEVNPVPSGGPFDEVIAEPAEDALPRLVARWLGENSLSPE